MNYLFDSMHKWTEKETVSFVWFRQKSIQINLSFLLTLTDEVKA